MGASGRAGLKKKRGGRGEGPPQGGVRLEVIITVIYVHIFISLYVYMNISLYEYISNYYLPGMSMEQTTSDLFNPFGAALRTIFRHP
jgi:hypothetical protein